MNDTALKQLYVRFCVTLRAIFAHPACTKSLSDILAAQLTHARNECYEPKKGAATSPAKALDYAKTITFGLHDDLEERDAAAVRLPKPPQTNPPLPALFFEFGEVCAQIAASADVPAAVYNALTGMCLELSNENSSADNVRHEAVWARYFTPRCLLALAGLSEHEQAATKSPDEAPGQSESLIAENARLKLLLEQAQSREQSALEAYTDLEKMFADAQTERDLAAENARLRLLLDSEMKQVGELSAANGRMLVELQQAKQRVTGLEQVFRRSPSPPEFEAKEANKKERLSCDEAELWGLCDDLLTSCDYEPWAMDALLLLIWNATNHKDRIDISDNLLDRLYAVTQDRYERREEYMLTLRGKNYRQAEEQTQAAKA